MTILDMAFTPVNGLKDASYSPTTPANEASIRAEVQGISDQLRDYINTLLAILHSSTLGASGSEEISSPTISGLTGNNVFEQISNMLTVAQSAQAGTILNGTVTDDKLSNDAGMVKSQLEDMKYQLATGTATEILLTTPMLVDGYSKTFIANATSTSTSKTINGKPFYKPGTVLSPSLTTGKAYTVWYNLTGDCFFIKASTEGDATTGNVLAGKTFSSDIDTGLIGTMINKVGSSTIITPSGTDEAIPQGYYGGLLTDGKVKAISLQAGNVLWNSNDTLRQTNLGTPTKLKETTITNNGGTVRVKFDLNVSSGAFNCTGRIYVNGVASGTIRNNATTSPITFTEDISFNAGDLIQVYGSSSAGGAYNCLIQNLRLYVLVPLAIATPSASY